MKIDYVSKDPKFLKVSHANVTRKNSHTGQEFDQTFEFLNRPDSVGVLIYHSDKKLFTWVEQFRIGQASKSDESNTIEPVAGMIESGQTPLEAANREVLEETGLKAASLKFVTSFLMCPGISNEKMHLYFADVQNQPLNVFGGLAEEQEDIKIHHWTYEETEQAIKEGKMNNAHALLLWNYVIIHKPHLEIEHSESYGL